MAGVFSKILNFNLTGNKTVIGVDIGMSAIKVVELSNEHGKAVLKNYGEIALGPYASTTIGQAVRLSEERIAQAIADVLTEAKIETRKAVLALPLGATLLSFIEVPTAKDEQLAKIIPLEARKYIPVPISEVTLDWWVLPKHGEATAPTAPQPTAAGTATEEKSKEMSEVVISAIHDETLNKYLKIQTEAHLEVDQFEIEIFSSIRSVIGRDMTPIMVLDMGAGSTKLAMVEYGIVKGYHIINKGAQDITLALASSLEISMEKAEEVKRAGGLDGVVDGKKVADLASATLEYIFGEAENEMLKYQRKSGKPVSRLIMVGGGAMLKGVDALAHNMLKIEVVRGDPFAKTAAPAFLEPTLREAGPEFAVAIGAALKALGGE
jgi:type IV pilus assembly protein PilM